MGDVEEEKDIVILTEEEDEDSLVEEGREIERGTVSHRDTSHREIPPKKHSCKAAPA